MRKLFLWVVLLLSFTARAQHNLHLVVKDDETKLPLPGVTAYITDLKKGAVSDTGGHIAINNIPAGKYEVKLSMVGYLGTEKNLYISI